MEWINIKHQEPIKSMVNCEIKTNQGRELIVDYDEEFGLFMKYPYYGNEAFFGWKNNGDNPELVTHWKEGVILKPLAPSQRE